MRQYFERWGQVIFLDAMGTRLNNLSWPYFAVTIIDSQGKSWAVCEGVYYGEKREFYAKMLIFLHEMSPSVVVDTMFSDQFLPKYWSKGTAYPLAVNLSCEWHLLNQTFPQHYVGAAYAGELKTLWQNYIQGDMETKIETARKALKSYFKDKSKAEREYADKYLDDPYYTRYFKQQHLTFGYTGQSIAEANHSGLNSWMSQSSAKQTSLIELFVEQLKRWDRKGKVQNKKLRTENGAQRMKAAMSEDTVLKQIYGLFGATMSRKLSIEYKRSQLYVSEGRRDGFIIVKHIKTGKIRIFDEKDRCVCPFRIMFSAQCRHEFCHCQRLVEEYTHPRWDIINSYDDLLSPERERACDPIPPPESVCDDDDKEYSMSQDGDDSGNRDVEVLGVEDTNLGDGNRPPEHMWDKGDGNEHSVSKDGDENGDSDVDVEVLGVEDAKLPSRWNMTQIQTHVIRPLLYAVDNISNHEHKKLVIAKLLELKDIVETRIDKISTIALQEGIEPIMRAPDDKRPLGCENSSANGNTGRKKGRIRASYEGPKQVRRNAPMRKGCKLCGITGHQLMGCGRIRKLKITPLSLTQFNMNIADLGFLSMDIGDGEKSLRINSVRANRHILVVESVAHEKMRMVVYEQGKIVDSGVRTFMNWHWLLKAQRI